MSLSKQPRWGKKRIAKFYFKGDDGQHFKKRTWVFRGETNSNSRYKKDMNGKKIFLVDPTYIVTTMTAMEYLIPKSLKAIHAFHFEKKKVVQINLKASLKSQRYYGSMKEKLMKKQNGICSVCNNKLIRQDQKTFLIQDLEIHHIKPIKKKVRDTKYRIWQLYINDVIKNYIVSNAFITKGVINSKSIL